MIVFFKTFVLFVSIVLTVVAVGSAQQTNNTSDKNTKEKPAKTPTKQTVQALTAEQVAESAIFIYGGLLGRQNLDQIRKTAIERGKIVITESDGRKNTAVYERLVVRGENLNKEKIRFDQSFPGAKYALVYNAEKIFGVYNDTVFSPRDDAVVSFRNQIWHSIESLLRYKENESKLELIKREKFMGVEFYLLDVTDKQNRKTLYYVSVKSLRVMMLEYESEGKKYRRKFYDYNYAQGTLVPYRSVLWADDKEIEEVNVGTITFGQKIEDTVFQEG